MFLRKSVVCGSQLPVCCRWSLLARGMRVAVLCFISLTCLKCGIGRMMIDGSLSVSSRFGAKFSVFCVFKLPTGTLLGMSFLRGLVIELIRRFQHLCAVILILCLIEA